VEDELKAKGGTFSKGADWQPYMPEDGLLRTGQNTASSGPAAKAFLAILAKGQQVVPAAIPAERDQPFRHWSPLYPVGYVGSSLSREDRRSEDNEPPSGHQQP
jgi:hypothetical protein